MKSELDFEVLEKPVYTSVGDKIANVFSHKALVRKDNNFCLNIVRSTYRTIQNSELIDWVERGVEASIGTENLQSADVKEFTAKGGQMCRREWLFRKINQYSLPDANSKICYKIVAKNSFGVSTARVAFGAADLVCENGMVSWHDDSYEMVAYKHFGCPDLSRIVNSIEKSLEKFVSSGETWLKWQETPVEHARVMEFLQNSIESERLRENLEFQIRKEYENRGKNLWAVYSALTYYASHVEGDFATSASNQDNELGVLTKREMMVDKLVQSDSWTQLPKAA